MFDGLLCDPLGLITMQLNLSSLAAGNLMAHTLEREKYQKFTKMSPPLSLGGTMNMTW